MEVTFESRVPMFLTVSWAGPVEEEKEIISIVGFS